MERKYAVRLMRTEIKNLKNVSYGEVSYMNRGSINKNGEIKYPDVVGIYGQNGSGKTTLVEALDILKYAISGRPVPYDTYSGILSEHGDTSLSTEFFVKTASMKYKVVYTFGLRCDTDRRAIQVWDEKIEYWQKGYGWKAGRSVSFRNPFYDGVDVSAENVSIKADGTDKLISKIIFLSNMQSLALIGAQRFTSVFFNDLVLRAALNMGDDPEEKAFRDVIIGIMQFGFVDLYVIRVNQLAAINDSAVIPINVHTATETNILQGCITLCIKPDLGEIKVSDYERAQAVIKAINTALRSIVPNLQIELEKKEETVDKRGERIFKIEVYSNRDGKRFPLKYESEGIKRIVSILHYLVSVFNDQGVCLVVDELDSGIFEFLLGEMLGLMHHQMKGQLIFTSHNLRVLEKLDAGNIICSTINPNNRYIRLTGIEKNHNKRDFYLRTLSIGGQKEQLYDDGELMAMGYSFWKAGQASEELIGLASPELHEDK